MTALPPPASANSSIPKRDPCAAACELQGVTPGADQLPVHAACRQAAVGLLAMCLAGCARAPSFDILGSFFPAWLLCLAVGLLLSFTARWLLSRLGIVIAVPVLTYPCLTALFACALWLVFFQ